MRPCWGCEYHKVYDDFQVKGFRLCLFFRCALVISNSSDCCTVLVLLREVLHLLFPSDALWGCKTSRGGDCLLVLNISPSTLRLLISRILIWSFGQRVYCNQRFAEAADATLEYSGSLQNLLLSKHVPSQYWRVYVLYHKSLEQNK